MAIFGKREPEPETAGDPAARPAEAQSATFIGSGARFVGDLFGDEDIVVEGRFEGKIRVGGKVTVGRGGEVTGDVEARGVVVGGKVCGQILAQERAELLSSAVVEGSMQAPKIIIAEGAQLQGNVAMSPAVEGKGSRDSEGK